MNRSKKVLLLSVLALLFWIPDGWTQILTDDNGTVSSMTQWQALPELPDSLGVAGAFTGVHNDVLIVSGGANFPFGPPWVGGEKVYHDRIYILENIGDEYEWYTDDDLKLPRPLGYGVTAQTNRGLIIAGGTDGTDVFSDVYLLRYDRNSRSVEFEELPSLPVPLVFSAGAVLRDRLFVAGGQESKDQPQATNHFFSLDLNHLNSTDLSWETLPAWPGKDRVLATTAVQSDGLNQRLYLFGGRDVAADGSMEVLRDGFSYNPGSGRWDEVESAGEVPSKMASTALAFGDSHILFFGGDDGVMLNHRLEIASRINSLSILIEAAEASDERTDLESERESLQAELVWVLEEESVFSSDVLAYHTITDTWSIAGQMQQPRPVTTNAVWWNGNIILASGEISPGVRTNKVWAGTIARESVDFGIINYTILGIYILLLIGMGYYFSRRENLTDEFFLAGQRIPWWAAGMSIYATQLSAITFIAIPAVAFSTNWLVYPGYITIFLMVPIVVMFYLPFFRRLNITTAYEYLEQRFSLTVRLFGSLSFIIFQLGRMSVMVFLPALVITAIIGMDIYVAIILMGIFSIVYTVMGGMEAVVWTDVIQVVVLVFGIIYSLGFIITHVGGVGVIYDVAMTDSKLLMFDWSFSFTNLVTWSIFLGTFALQFGPYTTDQAVIQRYLTTKDEKEAAKSIWTNGIISVPTGFLFFALGVCLYVFYKLSPDLIHLGMQNDQIFPLFIGQQLPVGLSGLVIAGIFAASMSSLDSSMHSISTAWTVDFYKRFNPDSEEKYRLRLAKIVVAIVGVFGTAMACVLAMFPIQSLYFLFQEIVGLLSSALAGIFILGIFTERASSKGVILGAVTSLIVMAFVKFQTGIHFYVYPLIGMPVCIIVGYLFSIFLPSDEKNLTGLTYRKL
ncbi:MAG: sodium/solute symporter [Balneolaceae bacterium]|nr:sodium/solute symporter [Balneolaceae bacterium]